METSLWTTKCFLIASLVFPLYSQCGQSNGICSLLSCFSNSSKFKNFMLHFSHLWLKTWSSLQCFKKACIFSHFLSHRWQKWWTLWRWLFKVMSPLNCKWQNWQFISIFPEDFEHFEVLKITGLKYSKFLPFALANRWRLLTFAALPDALFVKSPILSKNAKY